ncbi:hypothetical protein SCLCIDRAFT_776469 [Scleroderma citrinum Foug A]|uniref:Uncharacterized protein n=1 Tax=Scleroderma citrinum Foug A TaxID=1036808 RepID=A0A0C3E2T3_9AGAM|nr:hypothetical protein SCLCIDRAFT_776469 [Scleroderma citrinum Foug A]
MFDATFDQFLFLLQDAQAWCFLYASRQMEECWPTRSSMYSKVTLLSTSCRNPTRHFYPFCTGSGSRGEMRAGALPYRLGL